MRKISIHGPLPPRTWYATEAEWLAAVALAEETRLRGVLTKIQRKPDVAIERDSREALETNGYVYFAGPRDGHPYNCLHLTGKAKALIA